MGQKSRKQASRKQRTSSGCLLKVTDVQTSRHLAWPPTKRIPPHYPLLTEGVQEEEGQERRGHWLLSADKGASRQVPKTRLSVPEAAKATALLQSLCKHLVFADVVVAD